MKSGREDGHYGRLALMVVLSFASMYVLMYAMVNAYANAFPNLNQAYMAGLMTAPMVLIELALMGRMYPRRGWNLAIISVSVLALAACWMAIRQQALISDEQFLKSMIPHHAGAILMCEKAPIRDAEIEKLCRSIISSQQSEIDQMKAKLSQLDSR